MIPILKAEFRKLLTVRSTYLVTGLMLVGIALIMYFAFGRQQNGAVAPGFLYGAANTSLGIFATFGAIVAALLITHEYRYNYISYTLTAHNSRLKVFFGKLIVVITYALIGGFITALVGILAAYAGAQLVGATVNLQNFPTWSAVGYMSLYITLHVVLGLLLGLLTRSVITAIVIILFAPTVEALLGLLLKDSAKYLPFSSLEGITATGAYGATSTLSPGAATGLASAYVVGLAIIAAALFMRRNAN